MNVHLHHLKNKTHVENPLHTYKMKHFAIIHTLTLRFCWCSLTFLTFAIFNLLY